MMRWTRGDLALALFLVVWCGLLMFVFLVANGVFTR